MLPREPYNGPTRKLVIAFDVGTTVSGVSYCVLCPGEFPVIQGVARSVARSSTMSLVYGGIADILRKSMSEVNPKYHQSSTTTFMETSAPWVLRLYKNMSFNRQKTRDGRSSHGMYIVEEKYWLFINLGQVGTSSSCQASHIISHTRWRYRTSPTRQVCSRSSCRLPALPLPMR
jgi:hypothetical protein